MYIDFLSNYVQKTVFLTEQKKTTQISNFSIQKDNNLLIIIKMHLYFCKYSQRENLYQQKKIYAMIFLIQK